MGKGFEANWGGHRSTEPVAPWGDTSNRRSSRAAASSSRKLAASGAAKQAVSLSAYQPYTPEGANPERGQPTPTKDPVFRRMV